MGVEKSPPPGPKWVGAPAASSELWMGCLAATWSLEQLPTWLELA